MSYMGDSGRKKEMGEWYHYILVKIIKNNSKCRCTHIKVKPCKNEHQKANKKPKKTSNYTSPCSHANYFPLHILG